MKASSLFPGLLMTWLLPAASLLVAAPGDISTVAGDGGSLYDSGDEGNPAIDASIFGPNAIAYDPSDGSYYLTTGNRVRRIDSSGIITLFAGTGVPGYSGDDGLATAAQLRFPSGLAVDSAGNVFIAENNNSYKIRRVDAMTGVITTICGNETPGNTGDGGQAQNAQISPVGMEFDSSGNLVIACGSVVRRIVAGDGNIDATDIIERIAGTGSAGSGADGIAATSSALQSATDVAFDPDGDLYIADLLDHKIRKVDMMTGIISTFAGDGVAGFVDDVAATSGRLNGPSSVEVDASYNVFIVDNDNERIRKVFSLDSRILSIAGTGVAGYFGDGGSANVAQLNNPWGIVFDGSQNLLVTDNGNHRVRRIESVAAFVPAFQPDNAIGAKSSSLRGNGVYNGVGNQKVRILMKKGKKAGIFYRLENDGNADDQFRVTVNRGDRRRFQTKWIAGGANVGGAMLAGTYVSPTVGEGESLLIVGQVKRRADRGATTYVLRSTSVSDVGKFDQAQASVKIKLQRGGKK
ncbi:MAG: hypothetical protein KDN18_08960 [Verrucomicrobiae bacterium]|nr:hypothetical protein [Verrucomicrobiae bacterium]